VPGNVVSVHSNVLSEIGYSLFRVLLGPCESGLEFARGLCLLSPISCFNDFAVGEEMRSDLIEWGKYNMLSQRRMDDRNIECIHEFSLIDNLAEVSSVADECIPVLAVNENIEEHKCFSTMPGVEEGEPVPLLKKSVILNVFHDPVDSLPAVTVM